MKKTILVTGSTDGIGKLVAIKLAKDGHQVYIHGRNAEKLAATIAEIQSVSNNQNVDGFVADFSNLNAVSKMADQIVEKLPELDILINNAGVFKSKTQHNTDGLDMRMVVNYLAPFLLTEKLIPILKAAKAPRIINLSSAAQASVSLPVLTGEANQSENGTYAQSKLALTMWSFHLAKKEKDIAVIAVNPGSLLNTKMVKEAYGRHWSSADKGANILYELAVSEKYKNTSGKYFDNDNRGFGEAHADAYNEQKIAALLQVTKDILKA